MSLLRWLWWYLRELSGDTAYDHYVERFRYQRAGEPVPSRREFERLRARHREHNPQSRCC